MNKRQERKETFRKIGAAISKRVVWDRDYGGITVNSWGVRKSAGFDVLQIITEPRLSKLEQRSLETEKVSE